MAAGGGLGAKGLHYPDGGEVFGGIGTRLGERILRRAGPFADQAAGGHQRQDDDGNGKQHSGGKLWARINHHRDRAGEQKQIAQRDRCRGTEGGLHLGRVGGEPRHELANSRGVEKRRVETAQMLEHIRPEVGDDTFAERRHEIESRIPRPAPKSRRRRRGQENM